MALTKIRPWSLVLPVGKVWLMASLIPLRGCAEVFAATISSLLYILTETGSGYITMCHLGTSGHRDRMGASVKEVTVSFVFK